jgi:ribosome assembly protein YihI (activator of Der GTPase)
VCGKKRRIGLKKGMRIALNVWSMCSKNQFKIVSGKKKPYIGDKIWMPMFIKRFIFIYQKKKKKDMDADV